MFGLFKTKITPEEFGRTVMQWSNEEDFWDKDTSETGEQFLERHGVPFSKLNLYIRTFVHCSIHAASTKYGQEVGKAIALGAMTNFAKTPAGYEFEATYNALEAVYRGSHKLDQRVEALSNPGFDSLSCHTRMQEF
jgi:hypothetical protein